MRVLRRGRLGSLTPRRHRVRGIPGSAWLKQEVATGWADPKMVKLIQDLAWDLCNEPIPRAHARSVANAFLRHKRPGQSWTSLLTRGNLCPVVYAYRD